jgi:ribosomal protein S12 methylthiotransferase accessory factor YcaO
MRYALALLPLLLAAPALAQESCDERLEKVRDSLAQTELTTQKDAQIRALLEQIERACAENDEVVAQAGIDQIQAILEQEKRS